MNDDFEQPALSRYPLVGLLTGFMTVIINFIIYFSFDPAISHAASFINIVTLIYGSLVPATIGGMLYYFLSMVKKGRIIYIIVFSGLTFLSLYLSFRIRWLNDPKAERQFHELFMLMIINVGFFGTLMVPFLARNKKLTAKII